MNVGCCHVPCQNEAGRSSITGGTGLSGVTPAWVVWLTGESSLGFSSTRGFLTPFSLLAQGGTEGFDLSLGKRWDLSEGVKTTVLLKAIPLDETVAFILNLYAFCFFILHRSQHSEQKIYSLHHYTLLE